MIPSRRQLPRTNYVKYDLLIGLNRASLWNMHRICGGFGGRIHLLMDYTDRPNDVADPWCSDDFETTWRNVLTGRQELQREAVST